MKTKLLVVFLAIVSITYGSDYGFGSSREIISSESIPSAQEDRYEFPYSCTSPIASCSIISPVTPIAGVDSLIICSGESITFDASQSYSPDGLEIVNYMWDFGNGTILNTEQSTVTETFAYGGLFFPVLTVVDEEGCSSVVWPHIVIQVLHEPNFELLYPDLICVSEIGVLTGQAATQNIIENINCYSNETQDTLPFFLSDDVGEFNLFPINISQFSPGDTISECSDLIGIYTNMEHSFLGDLQISVVCPNGTAVILHNQGGGGTHLGEAEPFDMQGSPGLGYDYGWSSGSELGLMIDTLNHSPVTYVTAEGYEITANTVDPGIYAPAEDLCSLVGCPVNGTWTFRVADLWGADSGYLFDWCIEFDSSWYQWDYQPQVSIGANADSTFWQSDANVIFNSSDGDSIAFTSSMPGDYTLTYTAVDNFGCQASAEAELTVVDTPPDFDVLTIDTVPQSGVVQLGLEESNVELCDFSLILVDSWADGWGDGFLTVTIDDETNTYTHIGDGNVEQIVNFENVEGGSEIEIFYTAGEDSEQNRFRLVGPTSEILFELEPGTLMPEGLVYSGVLSCLSQLSLDYSFLWSPGELLDDPTSMNPIATITSVPSCFTLEVSMLGLEGCSSISETCIQFADSFFVGGYALFPDSIATWHVQTDYNNPVAHLAQGNSFKLNGDTIITGIEYSKMYERRAWTQGLDGEVANSEESVEPYELIGALREDDQKVYFINVMANWWENFGNFNYDFAIGEEVMLFDFDVDVGDVQQVYMSGVDESVEIQLEEKYFGELGRQYYSYSDPFGENNYVWIEGVGALHGSPFSRFQDNGIAENTNLELICFSVNEESVYVHPDLFVNCQNLTSSIVDVTDESGMSIVPNPSTGIATIYFPRSTLNESVGLKVIDNQGRLVKNYAPRYLEGNNLEVDLSALEYGIYTIAVSQGEYFWVENLVRN